MIMGMITGMTTATATIMTTENADQSLLRLLTWLSPAFPVGGFAYSGGLEAAVREGHVGNAADLRDWLDFALTHGPAWNDAVLLAEAWNAGRDRARLTEAADLARALAGSAERHLESTAQGDAFTEATRPWLSHDIHGIDQDMPYCIAVGAVAAASGVALHATLVAWLHALSSQLVSAAIRLSVLGQREAVGLLQSLEPVILLAAGRAQSTTLGDLGSAAVISDILTARHENLGVRLFRS
jgi:urease accessory protein